MDYKATTIAYADALGRIAYIMDSMNYILQDVQEGYFEKYDPERADGHKGIVWEFPRNRAKTAALSLLMEQIQQALGEVGISR